MPEENSVKEIYNNAKLFLLERIPSKQRNEILDDYLELPDGSAEPVEKCILFESILRSAQNANMKTGVIGDSIDGVHRLGKILFDFDPERTLEAYAGRAENLLSDIENKLKPRGKFRNEPRSLWPKYCKTILSSATFLSQFQSGEEFYQWANLLYRNQKTMPALPMIIDAEIEGIGYTLACDFLKELGFIEYGKPDTHIIEIFIGIGLSEGKPSPYQVQKIISRIAESAKVSPYNVDKLFWLIGSGKFYKHTHLGNGGKIGSLKQEYIDYVNA